MNTTVWFEAKYTSSLGTHTDKRFHVEAGDERAALKQAQRHLDKLPVGARGICIEKVTLTREVVG